MHLFLLFKSLNPILIHSENRKQVETYSYGSNGSVCVFMSHIAIWWETINLETVCKHHARYHIWWSDAFLKMNVMKSVKWCTNNLQICWWEIFLITLLQCKYFWFYCSFWSNLHGHVTIMLMFINYKKENDFKYVNIHYSLIHRKRIIVQLEPETFEPS